MIAYCVNTILCSAVLLLLYKLLLENEKVHGFKRLYLFFSVVFSIVAPLITLPFGGPEQYLMPEYIPDEPIDYVVTHITPFEIEDILAMVLIFVYLSGVNIVLFRLIKNVSGVFIRAWTRDSVPFAPARVVLMESDVLPHSFFSKIFVNKESFLTNTIEQEILVHELAHVRQRHSLDIVFVKLVHCFFWFNPVYIFYIRTIALNHEFLADEIALQASGDPQAYQNLLLQKASVSKSSALTSDFNYSIIKKRLVMIVKQTSRRVQWVKASAAISLFFITVFLFATKETMAQKGVGASAEMIAEYEHLAAKGETDTFPWWDAHVWSKDEKERMYVIYSAMTTRQRRKQDLHVPGKTKLLERKPVTDEQLKIWTDSKYEVYIDGKRVNNEILESRASSDFDWYKSRKLSKWANDGKHQAQIALMTKEQFARNIQSWNEEGGYMMVMNIPNNIAKLRAESK